MNFLNFTRHIRRKLRPRVFLDYASITPVSKEVLKVMRNYESRLFANPSALYSEALLAKEEMNKAREVVANELNSQKKEIVFTSSGTESNNLAILGIFESFKTEGFTPHIITTNIEHPSVLEVCKEIERRGGEVTYIKVRDNGLVSVKDIKDAIKKETILVSIMYTNNEIGTIQPIKEIGRVIKEYREKNKTATDREGGSTEPRTANVPYFHTDACQAGLYLDLDVLKLNLDLMTLDGIKMYGPRSTGILYVKNGVKISPIIFGGGQEKGLRSSTENVAGIVGFAKALEIASFMREKETVRLTVLRDYAIDEILKNFKGSTLNGGREFRLANNINICFPGLDAEFAVVSLDVAGVSVSYSSSCRTLKEDSSSYVIDNIGKVGCSTSSLRISLGRKSTKQDVDFFIYALKKIVVQ